MIEDEKTIAPNELTDETVSLKIDRGTNFGRYVILKPIGKGGMGAVFAAYDSSLERKVAIKVLRADSPGKATTARQKRLLREAQAMARLSNPNVNAVHDVGLFLGRIFVAMEYVDGWTIRQWMRDKQRSWKEVVSVFMQAGQGLMAAHEAGLVHRDVKPDNILIGKDGRVRVTDFGLVSEVNEPGPDEQDTVDMAVPDACLDRTTQPLTRTGGLMGSPPYMAPEQHQGLPTDAKSDQFSFCVTLYEALYGKQPFEGQTSAELAEAIIHGRIQEVPAHSKVPSWLRAVLVRGLSINPENRYPSMKALLVDLGKNPARIRMRWLTWGGTALLVLALEWGILQRSDQGTLCRGAERHLVGLWDKNIRLQARSAFLATQVPYAKQTWEQVAQAIDRYSQNWVTHSQEACEATHTHGEQSTELLDLRMRCLDRRLAEVGELVKLLTTADRQMVEKAVQAAYKLTPLSGCADIDSLTAPIPLPIDPKLQHSIQQVENMLAKAKALGDSGKYKEATNWAQKAVQKTETLAHQPVQAEALYLLATIYNANGKIKKAEQTAKKAIWKAMAGKHDTVAAQAWNTLVYIAGSRKALKEGQMWAGFAEAAVKRVGNPVLEAELLNYWGRILKEQGRPHKAYDVYQESLSLRLKAFGSDHPNVASSYNSLGLVLNHLGRYEESEVYYKKALSIWEKAYGPQHQITANIINNLGYVLHRRGLQKEAIDHHLSALAIWEELFEPEHPSLSWAHNNLGIAYHGLRQYKKAFSHHKRALAIKQKAYGKQNPMLVTTLVNLGETLSEIGEYQKSIVHFQEAEFIIKNKLNNDDSAMGFLYRAICKALHKQKRLQQALSECEQSLARMEKAYGTEHPELTITLLCLGLIELDLGHIQRAERLLHRALTLGEKANLAPLELAPVRFALAKSLWPSPENRKWALELAREAKLTYQQAPDSFKNQKTLVTRWLAQRIQKTL